MRIRSTFVGNQSQLVLRISMQSLFIEENEDLQITALFIIKIASSVCNLNGIDTRKSLTSEINRPPGPRSFVCAPAQCKHCILYVTILDYLGGCR